ncbi:MAG: acyltransferase [Chloroflexi bacterium]|nr:acyltransferase [Chloroflexota bacterium]
MTLFVARLEDKFWGWVDSRLVEHRRLRCESAATLAATAQLGSEASIENILKDPSRINIGAHSYLRGRLLIYGHGGRISIGEWCYIGVRSELWSMNLITIGDRVLIAHDVNIHDGSAHSTNLLERHEHFRRILTQGHPRSSDELPGVSSAPIVIEDDVWISFGVTILKGVRIGTGSVIAAGSVVVDDVPPRTFYRNEVKPILSSLDS